jgi:hypothetical protein
MPRGVSEAEEKAREILSRYPGSFVSRRDGHVVVKIRDGTETVIIWIRQRPITRRALELFKKIVARHEYDKLVLLRLYKEADYVKYGDLSVFDEIRENDY